jgi:alpha-amylase/alpha-mannosidase (GH57 family)
LSTENDRVHPPRAHFVFHGHFYQPPRENPWTDEVEREPSARPYHDWNARITAECYAANAAARIHDERGRILRLVNNYEHISFNFGPTLLRWLERHDPRTLRRIVEADRASAARLGHGNAIAQTYNHMILALADARDRRTQIRWGCLEFEHRFGREPESLWLAETAANHAVLDEMIEQELRFVILAPMQAGRVRPSAHAAWQDVSGARVDPSRPYLYRHRDGSGRAITVFFYDGPLAQSVSFGGALRDGRHLAQRVEQAIVHDRSHPQLVHLAVDGETAGHHVGFGNLALAWALQREIPQRGLEVTNYAAYLDDHPATWECELDEGPFGEGTSWSCAHGVGRWIRDCSCRIDPGAHTQQAWRGPLRRALDIARDAGRTFFEKEASALLRDPWSARDDAIRLVLDASSRSRDAFFAAHAARTLSTEEKRRVLALMEFQHQAMLMYTSCGWFFDDIGGLESVQVLRYAARYLEMWEELGGSPPRTQFLAALARGRSNDQQRGTGADVFRRDALAVRVTPERIAAHLAMSSLLQVPPEHGQLALHRFERRAFHLRENGNLRLVTGRFVLEHARTLHTHDLQVAMLHRGGLEFLTVIAPYDEASFEERQARLHEAFEHGDKVALRALQVMSELEGPRFGAEDLMESGRQELLQYALSEVIDRFSEAYSALYAENREILTTLRFMGMELPEELRAATNFTLRKQLEREFIEHADADDPAAWARAIEVVREALAHDVRLDSALARAHFERMLTERIEQLATSIRDGATESASAVLRRIAEILDTAEALALRLDHAGSQLAFHEEFLEVPPDGVVALAEPLEQLALRLGFAPGRLDVAQAMAEKRG